MRDSNDSRIPDSRESSVNSSSAEEENQESDFEESFDEFNLVKLKFFYDDSIKNIFWNEEMFFSFSNTGGFNSRQKIYLISRLGDDRRKRQSRS